MKKSSHGPVHLTHTMNAIYITNMYIVTDNDGMYSGDVIHAPAAVSGIRD